MLYNYQGGKIDPLNFDIFGNASPYQGIRANMFLNAQRAIPGYGTGFDPSRKTVGTGDRGPVYGIEPWLTPGYQPEPSAPSTPFPFPNLTRGPGQGLFGTYGNVGPTGSTAPSGGAEPWSPATSQFQFPALKYPTPGSNVIGSQGGLPQFPNQPDLQAYNLGGSATNWTPEYGGVPNVANPMVGEASALQFNLANLPQLSQLAGGINTLNQSELLAAYEQAFPGFGARMAEGSEGIRSNLAGEISPGARAAMAIGAAERGLAGGQPGATPMTNQAYVTALGTTAEKLAALGQQQLDARIRSTPVVQPYDITKQFITGDQMTEAANMANLYAAAPIPTAQAAEEQRMAEQAMLRGISAEDWLAQRNYGRSAEQAAADREQALRQLAVGSQLSDWEQQRAWERSMAYLAAQKEPNQARPIYYPNFPRYNRASANFDFGGDMGTFDAATGKPVDLSYQPRKLTDQEKKLQEQYAAWYDPRAIAIARGQYADVYGGLPGMMENTLGTGITGSTVYPPVDPSSYYNPDTNTSDMFQSAYYG